MKILTKLAPQPPCTKKVHRMSNSAWSTFPWIEGLFEKYKENPNSEDNFEVVRMELEAFMKSCNLEELLDISEDSAGSYCGVSFKRDQLMYHCR